jgi:hypothetical protein
MVTIFDSALTFVATLLLPRLVVTLSQTSGGLPSTVMTILNWSSEGFSPPGSAISTVTGFGFAALDLAVIRYPPSSAVGDAATAFGCCFGFSSRAPSAPMRTT